MRPLLQAIIAAAVAAAITTFFYTVENSYLQVAATFICILGFKFIADRLPEQFSLPSRNTEIGQVKWFNVSKGFGFITRKNGEDIFVHYRCVRANGRGRRVLEDGQTVRFEIGEGDKGPQAENVRPIKA